ncbi:MAG: MG2 domain-containing protein [Nonlabens sp.]|nr:MG2 domain-containing protein [Nonlabens sp.]
MKKVLYFLIACLTIISCSKTAEELAKERENELFKFREHIYQITDNRISTREAITIVLQQPVEGWVAGKVLGDDVVTLSPDILGETTVIDAQTISFQPSQPLAQDKEYEVIFKLGKVKKVAPTYKEFKFYVKTMEQDFIVRLDPVGSYNRDLQYIKGTIATSDLMERKDAQKLIEASLDGSKLDINFITTDKLSRLFEFKIDRINRPQNDADVLVSWNGSPIYVKQNGNATVTLPGKTTFIVTDVRMSEKDTNYVLINFSDPLNTSQNFDGLVQIEDATDLKYEVYGHLLKVYIASSVTGSKKIDIFQGIKSIDGYTLKDGYSNFIAFEQTKPAIKLVRSGVILPSSQNLKINFQSVNLNAVDVWVYKVYKNNILQYLQNNTLNETNNLRQVGRPVARKILNLQGDGKDVNRWNTYSIDLSKIIAPDPGAMYRVEFKYNLSYSAYPCNDGKEKRKIDYNATIEDSSWDVSQGYYYDDDYYYDNDYDWRERENPCHSTFYSDKSVSTNVLASDLGITVKKGSANTYFLTVSNIVTTAPMSGAQIQLYNYQQQEIATDRTDGNGFATVKTKKPAYFAKVTSGKQYGYIRLDDGSALSTSTFDTSGTELEKGLKGYIYGERDVWRPGDNIYLTFVLNDAENKLPANHPVTLELRDPNGKMVYTKTHTGGLNNFYPFDLKTNENAPTGNWSARVQVGGATFYKYVKVETIKPNRLKVDLTFKEDIIKSGQSASGNLQTMWLHGATAKNLKATITAKFYSTATSFKGYEKYQFDDPSRDFETQEVEVFNGTVNDSGAAAITLNPTVNEEAPGMLKASFLTKVFENGGDFSTNVTTKTFSPYSGYVGVQAPEGDKRNNMLVTDKDHTFNVASIDQYGKARAASNLEVNVYQISWRWWWQSQSGSVSRYEAREYRDPVYSTKISTNNSGKGSFKFKINQPAWGRYLVRIYDPSTGHATGKIVYVDWPDWAGNSRETDPATASMLLFNADKETYKVGEQAKLNVPTAAGGRLLVTIENGTQVLDAQWVETKQGNTQVTIPLKENYVPNVYAHVTYVQKHAKTENDTPLRMYGVIPILVENKETHLNPVINMQGELRPESTTSIEVKEQNGKAMTYTLSIVDEGLLDITNYKTPNPWDKFFAREALGVRTWDVYDDVIGAYGGRIEAAFAIGGDASANASKAKKANRFKPMVVHLGPFELPAGGRKSHTVKIPQYVGSVRVMVVAGNSDKESYGNAEKTVPVKKPLMMLASLPRKLSPGETVRLPITVFAMDKKIRNVNIKLASSPYFKLLGNANQSLTFTETGDQIAYFDIQVADKTGIAKLDLSASGSGESAVYSTEIDVVNPNIATTISNKEILKPGETKTLNIQPFGVSGTNSAVLTVSTLPAMDLGRRLDYVVRYPHGCIEQTTSAAFPQLHLAKVIDLDKKALNDIEVNIKAALSKIDQFQQPNGGLTYWPGYGEANDWGTTYAGHFMLEAEKAGYKLPVSFKSNWITYQKRAAKEWRFDRDNDLNQAYRLYTLALAGAADLSSMNRLRESNNLSNDSKLRLAAAYALVGQSKAATELVNKANIDFKPSRYDYRNYGSPQRNRAMALETFVTLKQLEKARNLMEDIARELDSDNYYNTQATAYSLLAIGKYAQANGGKGLKASTTYNGKTTQIATAKSIASQQLGIGTGATTVTIKNTGSSTLFITNALTGTLPVGKERTVQNKLRAVVNYTDRSGKTLNVSQLAQGTEIIITTTITNDTGVDMQNIACTQILPSGWEIINTRFTEYGASETSTQVDYTDIRDDRVNNYFSLGAQKSITLKTVMNASYLGTYYLPGVQCEAMYDGDYVVRKEGQWIEVVR